MANQILKQFGTLVNDENYKFGVVSAVNTNNIYVIDTSGGLKLTIQDFNLSLSVGDPVLLALSEGQTNNAFIIKKGSKKSPIAKNYIVGNNLN